MALTFFTQQDIDQIDINDIPEEFINYINSLTNEEQAELVGSRPQLAAALGITSKDVDITSKKFGDEEEINNDAEEHLPDGMLEDDEFAEIRENVYEGRDLKNVFVNNMQPLEALTIPDHTTKCILHRTEFQNIQIKYTEYGDYSIVLRVCQECRRAYIEESSSAIIHDHLVSRNIAHHFYGRELTERYLHSQIKEHEFAPDEKLFIPEVWIEERPICPVHETELYKIPCSKSYKNRKVTFDGYLCEQCGKVLIRKASLADLEDECAISGVPVIPSEKIFKRELTKKVSVKKQKPDFIIAEGKKSPYTYSHITEFYTLTEKDFIIVSDSIYCDLNGHDSTEIPACLKVMDKKGRKNLCVLMLGYCKNCRKYYMDIEDYKVVYKIGRPEATIIRDFEDSEYMITSGEIFNLEQKHLSDLEYQIDASVKRIISSPDYINPYTTGDYDDGNLAYAKAVSRSKYSKLLETLENYTHVPYSYRVDIGSGDITETYYVGTQDVIVDGKKQVISANSDFGHELVNYRTQNIKKDGKKFDIKLSRKFDIYNAALYGYMNLRTNEDIIFKSGITDPFLVRVLNLRKKQHELTDIFVTIQENQTRIVNADFKKNLIVQGCAGSGKTMVLLHRLSSLSYKQKNFDFPQYAMILTPNDNFNLHIGGLAEGLKIDNIERISIEQYYIDRLIEYDPAFKPREKLTSEMDVQQDFVDYIYSNAFKDRFAAAYKKIIDERNSLTDNLDSISNAMGRPGSSIDLTKNANVTQQIRYALEVIEDSVIQRDQQLEESQNSLKSLISRQNYLKSKIPEAETFLSDTIKDSISRVNKKVEQYTKDRNREIELLNDSLREAADEHQKIQNTFFMFGKQGRLKQSENQIKDIEQKLKDSKEKQNRETAVFSKPLADISYEEMLFNMEQISKYIKNVQDEIRSCAKAKRALNSLLNELPENESAISEAKNNLELAESGVYSAEIKQAIQSLYEQLEKYTLLNTFQQVFDEAAADFKKEHNVTKIKGKYHRYELYAQLLFAKMYFGSVNGKVRFMCVDEGQDISFNEYLLIYELNSRDMILNIFGDTNQLIKPGRGISDWEQLKINFGAEEYVLNENYRNTNQITGFCNASFEMDVLQTGADGPEISEIPRKDLEKNLAELNITTERVAVLIPRSISKNKYLNNSVLPENIKKITGDKIGNGYISLMYVDEIKGIEFDRVYVDSSNMKRNEKYIAYTRALSELIILVSENGINNSISSTQQLP